MKITITATVIILVLSASTAMCEKNLSQNQEWFSGYSNTLSGNKFQYHSPIPTVNSALLVRALNENQVAEWETDKVPVDFQGESIKFIWMFAIDVNPNPKKFRLYVNNEEYFLFENPLSTQKMEWKVPGKNGAELFFKATLIDRHDDLQGFAVLKIPAENLVAGKRVKIKVVGEPAGSHAWYMTFRFPITESVSIKSPPVLLPEKDGDYQPLIIDFIHIGDPLKIIISSKNSKNVISQLEFGINRFELLIPAVDREKQIDVLFEIEETKPFTQKVIPKRVRKMEIYILPHSHTDIGYTDIQTEVERQHVQFIDQALGIIDSTATYPAGAQYKWNIEVSWALDAYLTNQPSEKRERLITAIKEGHIGIEGLYNNVLSGLCRPEELLRLFNYSVNCSEKYGLPKIESAMISDVPGYTWGIVGAMSQAGIKYFSPAPNYFDRIGTILATWEDKPFYWLGPSSKDKVLVWIPFFGYGLSHTLGCKMTENFVFEFMDKLEEKEYPYDLTYLRWSGLRDNWGPEPQISEFIKRWNTKYAYPKFFISTTPEVFRKFEGRYGDQLPIVQGDWTPYWEDGAASSAKETAINRASSERLVQAEALWAMLNPAAYPKNEFYEAWKNVLMYSEHTWGADVSVTAPESKKTRELWEIKQAFAFDAEEQSLKLIEKAFEQGNLRPSEIDVFNTNSWKRTDLVYVPTNLSKAGDKVTDQNGNPVPCQRLSNGELVFVVKNIPPFAAKRYKITPGEIHRWDSKTKIEGTQLDNGIVTVKLDKTTGNICEVYAEGIKINLVDLKSDEQLNGYLFLPGKDLANIRKAGKAKIKIKENGPLVVSLMVESDAPGCNKLNREIKLIDGFDRVDIINTIDKKRAELKPNLGNWDFARSNGKEGLHFAYPFNVPDGIMRIDIPFAVMRPETDQIPSACKNWFSVQRWIDISNEKFGVTWANADAPMVEVGEISGNILGNLGEQKKLDYWRSKVEPTQKFYSWVMNNHWHTNYRAYQEGFVTFSYSIRPHKKYNAVEVTRFGISFSQPLIVAPAKGEPVLPSLLRVEPEAVIVTSLKPSEDGKAWMVRLFNAGGSPETVELNWRNQKSDTMYFSNLLEKKGTGENFSAQDIAINLTYARKIANWFAFGTSVKYISSQIWHTSANAIALDVGVSINTVFFSPDGSRKNGLKIGMSISNYGSPTEKKSHGRIP